MKLSVWYLSDVKPQLPGVYERMLPRGNRYSYWDGKTWYGWADTLGDAYRNYTHYGPSSRQDVPWRGLAKPAK